MLAELSGRDVTDILVTWLGAFGVFAYLRYIHQGRSRSAQEGRTLFLLYCGAALFLLRGFFWASGYDPLLGALSFIPITLFPLAVTLLVESMLRRHAPPVLKFYVAGGTVVFLALTLTGHLAVSKVLSGGWMIFMLSVLLALAWMIVARNRADLSPAENRLADLTARLRADNQRLALLANETHVQRLARPKQADFSMPTCRRSFT